MSTLSFDVGSNSVGSVWLDAQTGTLTSGISIFPEGVKEETDKGRGEPKNAARRQTRRTRITLARRSTRKRLLRKKLVEAGLLPADPAVLKALWETDPWELRQRGLDEALKPFEFGRVLLHLAQRRGAAGLKTIEADDKTKTEDKDESDDGKVKAAIGEVRAKMLEAKARTFGEFMMKVRKERTHEIKSEDHRPEKARRGKRIYQDPIRNKGRNYEHCADRDMIRDEFKKLWEKQKSLSGPTTALLTDDLREALDNPKKATNWRHQGLLFGQHSQSWDLGTLGRCVLEPAERCVPHADRYASQFLVVETVNHLKIIERGKPVRPLTPEERKKIKDYLSGPLGESKIKAGKKGKTADDSSETKGKTKPKTSVTVTDLRLLMGWGKATKTSELRFNIETDENRVINTDWFSREIIHGAVTKAKWDQMTESVREGLNRAILSHDPEQDGDEDRLKKGVMKWAQLNETQADALIAAWKRRPKLDAKRLNMSRRAVRNLLVLMDREEPWPDQEHPDQIRWLTQIEARKLIAEDADFKDVTTGQPLDDRARIRYATGAKGATTRDRHYMKKHLLKKDGQVILDGKGVVSEPPPAPLISNPVVRKAIHEVRRHLVEYMIRFGRKPERIHIELAREAKMGKKSADELLFKNRLRNRIRQDIIAHLNLAENRSSTQQRVAVDRVVLCVQQNGVCPLCGNQRVKQTITHQMAADGTGCELAHILPRASGGENGLSNLVLAHDKCNRDMEKRTPRQFWGAMLAGGFDQGMGWVEQIYGKVERIKGSQIKSATGEALWGCYFNFRDDNRKIEQFKKERVDTDMTPMQKAATQYASRQIMTYLADALYDGKGLPERGGERRIYTTDGLWTSRLRREWKLFFDPHDFKAKGLKPDEEQERKEKDRGDHRHHAVDAAIIALCTPEVQNAWNARERQAAVDRINTADESQMENYRRQHPLAVPKPFKNIEELRQAIRESVYGKGEAERPVCHRPVKRKLIGALHEETLMGPALDPAGRLTTDFTAKKSVLALDPNHLRLPKLETQDQAVERLAQRWVSNGMDEKAARKQAKNFVKSPGYKPIEADPSPGKSGIVRDPALRKRLRDCLEEAGLNPDDFSKADVQKLAKEGGFKQKSGVPIKSMVLLRTLTNPVLVSRWANDPITGKRYKLYDAQTGQGDARAARAYVGGNNHHIEIRVLTNEQGKPEWSGRIITAYEASQRKLAKLQAMKQAGIPNAKAYRKLSASEKVKFKSLLADIERKHPLVDRSDDPAKGGRFVMSLCEGEMLMLRRKTKKEENAGAVGYFVVAKLGPDIFLVPHWDARAAGERKNSKGEKIPNSKRETISVTPTDLQTLAPPGHEHAVKVRVSPLGKIVPLTRD